MKNPERWSHPKLNHRKREGYIAAHRAFFELGSYANWGRFKYSDFLLRNRLARTFYARHLPLSDGEDHPEFEDLLEEPKEWNKDNKKSPEKMTVNSNPPCEDGDEDKMQTPPPKKVKVEKEESDKDVTPEKRNVTPLIMNFETGELVECIHIE